MNIKLTHIPMRTVSKLARHCHAQMRKADSQGESGKAHYHEGQRDAYALCARMLRPTPSRSDVTMRLIGGTV